MQKRLRIFRFGPVDEAAAVDIASGGKLFFGAFEGFLFEHRLRDWRGQATAFKVG